MDDPFLAIGLAWSGLCACMAWLIKKWPWSHEDYIAAQLTADAYEECLDNEAIGAAQRCCSIHAKLALEHPRFWERSIACSAVRQISYSYSQHLRMDTHKNPLHVSGAELSGETAHTVHIHSHAHTCDRDAVCAIL